MVIDRQIQSADISRGSTGDLHLWRVLYTHDGKLADKPSDHIARLITTEEIKILHQATSDFLKGS